jgi:type IV pilus assembly protein PilN
MRVRLNLATKPLETHRRFLAGAGLIAAVAGVAFFFLAWHVYVVRKADAQLRARAEKTRQELLRYQQERAELESFFSRPDNARLHDRAAFLNSILDARSFNWTLMFMDLEKVLPGGVRVVSIEPVQKNGRIEVRLSVGATNDGAKMKFLRALEESSAFTRVELVSEHVPNQTNSSDRVILDLTVIYSRS